MAGLMDRLMGVQESAGSGSFDIEPGAYKLVITKAEPMHNQEYVRIYWDVAEGERKGTYENSQYPPTDVLSWKEAALGMLKGKLHRLQECNPQRLHAQLAADGSFAGVPEFAQAVDARGEFGFLVGCRFGAVVRRRLYTAGPNSKNPGADRTAIEVARYLSPQEFADHDWPDSLLADRDQRDKSAQAPQEHVVPPAYAQQQASVLVYDEDVPF